MKAYNLVFPIAGAAKRFTEQGVLTPKPMIEVMGRSILERALDSFDLTRAELYFIVLAEHERNYQISTWLKERYGDDINITVLPGVTAGALCTCMAVKDTIDQDWPLVIYTPDAVFRPRFDPTALLCEDDLDGYLSLYPSQVPSCSYAKVRGPYVVEVAEKVVISPYATTGLYGFAWGRTFFDYAEQMLEKQVKRNGEYYIAPMYNLMIEDGLNVAYEMVEGVDVLGTPEQIKQFEERQNASCCGK